MNNVELLKKYAKICKKHRDGAGCEECELFNSCMIVSIDNNITIDSASMEELTKNIENTAIPYTMTITISYSAKTTPFIQSVISSWAINNFFQDETENIIMPIVKNVMNAEWALFISVDEEEEEYETDNGQYLHGVQKVTVDISYIEKIENYTSALSAEIAKAFKSLGLDTNIKIDFEA